MKKSPLYQARTRAQEYEMMLIKDGMRKSGKFKTKKWKKPKTSPNDPVPTRQPVKSEKLHKLK